MRFKRLLALLLAAALALAVLVGCGSGQQSAAQALLKLLDGKYPNISIEIDPDLEADLRQAISQAEAENAGDDDAVIRAALEKLVGSTVTFRNLGDGQQGDTTFDLVFYSGTNPNKAAQAAYSQWNIVFANVPDDGKYTAALAMVQAENGCFALVKATVDKAGTVDKPDKDDDEPETQEPPEQEKGYTEVTDSNGNVTGYTVKNADGLMAWNKAVQKDLSLNCTLTEDITIDSDWEPIGLGQKGFTGTFDGGNHTITMEGNGTQVLFQYIAKSGDSTGTVKDLTIQVDSTITGHDNSHFGAVAIINYGTIQNCHVTGGIIQGSTAAGYVGGIVGVNNGAIQGCSATVAVKNGSSTGGIVGINRGTVTACYSTGDVSGNEYTGGVVGWNNGGTVTACYHAGSVSGDDAGGVVGWNNGGTVTACYWSGYNGNGIGQDDTGKYSNTTSLEHNKYFGDHNNMVGNDTLTWANTVDPMNDAITENDSGCPYKWVANGDDLPTLTNQ